MGGHYSKCCGKIATHKITVESQVTMTLKNIGSFFKEIYDLTGHKAWSFDGKTYRGHFCNRCIPAIRNNLGKAERQYMYEHSREGFWHYDLP